jgi:DNA-binding transcriptional regulator of glucitol operon
VGVVLRLLVSPRWLVRHVLLVGAVTVCWFFGRWQYHRALARHSVLNWSYTVEWTLFAAFAVLCWGWFLRDELRGEPEEPAPSVEVRQRVAQPVTDDEDPELAAYNRMLSALHQKESP